MIQSVKIRFDKWKHTTPKAHLLVYRGREVWLPKKLCWEFAVAGNDLHAWATIPAWLFAKITGEDVNEVVEKYGTIGLKEYFGAMISTRIEHHTPERIDPVESNSINDLKIQK